MAVVLPFVATFADKGTKQAIAAIKKVESQWGGFGNSLKKASGPAAAVGGALVVALTGAKNAAGAAAKQNKVLKNSMTNSGFPENTQAAQDYAVALSKTTGISANEIKAGQARLATNKDLAGSQENLGKVTMLAADMSARSMGSMEQASATLAKALNDPVKGMALLARAGIAFDETTKASVKSAMESGDKLAAQQIILAQVHKTVGGAAEGTASSTAKMRAKYQELMVMIGQLLLPVMGKLVNILTTVITWMTENIGVTKAVIVVIGSLVTAILGLNAVRKGQQMLSSLFSLFKSKEAVSTAASTNATRLNTAATTANTTVKRTSNAALVVNSNTRRLNTTAIVTGTTAVRTNTTATTRMTVTQRAATVSTKLMTTAQRALNLAMKANPIGLVIGLITALAAAFAYAWKNSENFRRIVTNAFNQVKSVAQNVFGAIKSAIAPVAAALQNIIGLAQDVASAIGNVIGKLPSLRNAQAEAAKPLPTPASAMSRSAGTAKAAAPVYITVTGAIDPERVARQIRELLDGHDLRQGRMVTRAVAW
jgi:hypothetical protein